VLSALAQAMRNIPFFAVLAFIVAIVAGWLGGYVGTGMAIVFIAMLAVFLAQDLFTLGTGLFLLVLTLFGKGEGANPVWVLAGCLFNIVQGLTWAGMAYYVGRAVEWWA